MAENSKIEWTDNTFNPWCGCTKVSPGCKFCYADRQSKRNPKVLGIWGNEGTRVLASEAHWKLPEKWDREAKASHCKTLVFCASLADIFEDWDGQMTDSKGEKLLNYKIEPMGLSNARSRLWELIKHTPNLYWLLLTKRPENISKMMPHGDWPNVWLGTSVESQEHAIRLDLLCDAPQRVPVRFCSAEPLIGELNIQGSLSKTGINWVIVGGESGGSARTFRTSWCRSLLGQCYANKVACFIKQVGDSPLVDTKDMLTPSYHGSDWSGWPEWMRVRDFPISV